MQVRKRNAGAVILEAGLANAALEALDRLLVVTTAQLDWIWASSSARRELSLSQVLYRRGDALSAQATDDARRLQGLIEKGLATGSASDLLGPPGSPDHIRIRCTRIVSADQTKLALLELIPIGRRPRARLPDLKGVFGITPSEHQILEMMLQGFSGQNVADRLNISIQTVRTHRKHAYDKLRVGSREELFARLLPYMQSSD